MNPDPDAEAQRMTALCILGMVVVLTVWNICRHFFAT